MRRIGNIDFGHFNMVSGGSSNVGGGRVWRLILVRRISLLVISTWFQVIHTMFDSAHYVASLLGVHAPRQTSISDYVRLSSKHSCTQILVPCSFNQSALGYWMRQGQHNLLKKSQRTELLCRFFTNTDRDDEYITASFKDSGHYWLLSKTSLLYLNIYMHNITNL